MQKSSHNQSAVCERISRAAVEMGISNADLARKATVSERLVYKILNRAANLKPSTVGKLAQAIGVDFDYLMTGSTPNMVKESTGEYVARNKNEKPPTVDLCIRFLAIQLGVSEDEVRMAIAKLIERGGK